MPRAWVVLRRVWVALFTGALGMVLLLQLMHGRPVQSHNDWSVQRWIILSIAGMLFALPQDDREVIVCSQHELRVWQLKSFVGSLLLGISSLVCASRLADAPSDGAVAIACGITIICLLAAPWFFRLCAWRIWAGMALIVAGCVWV